MSDDLPPQLGRFRLLKQLGEGAQASVWLAHDPLLDREVAVKLLKPQSADDAEGHGGAVDQWLHEARAVSRLTHPNIVPVFEADTQAGRSYLVFEYVAGGTLSQRLRNGARPSAVEAVTWMLGILDGLAAAHAAGLVHRDLKPSNILLDAQGRPKVMDFGIAARVSTDAQGPLRIVGTPSYLSPEAARGAAPHPQMDVFAASVILAEMLSGRRLNHDADPWRSIRRVQTTDLSLPPDLDASVDDGLRAIVQRGLARDAAARWPSAAQMRDALAAWLRPVAEPAGDAAQDAPVLDFLLRRMRHKSDFPALSDAIVRIQRLTQSESESLSSLSNEILKDVALTQKLLRVVNTVQYRHAGGGGGIGTVSRAVALIGFAGIRNLALSLVLLERMENKSHARRLREDYLRSLMAAALARELCPNPREAEEAFLGAMFHHLGRSLTEFYFPEEAEAVRRLVSPTEGGQAGIPEEAASTHVLGMSYEALGLGIARQWGLPDGLQRAMRRPVGEVPQRSLEDAAERQRWLARASNDMADLLLETPPEQAHARLHALAQRHARALGITAESFEEAVDKARRQLTQITEALDLQLPKDSRAQRLLVPLAPAPDDTLTLHELTPTMTLERTQASLGTVPAERATDLLAAGVQDITDAMVENFQLNAILRMILETIYRSLGFRRVIFGLRDARGQCLIGRLGVGPDVERLAPLLRVDLTTQPPDLFAAVCLKGADTLIQDARAPNIAARLPTWFRGDLQAQSFLVLPLMVKGAPLGLIYADHAQASAVALGDKELSLLRTLRNQAVMAFRQSTG